MTDPVDTWSCPTIVHAGGLRQLPLALAGRPMLLLADGRLAELADLVHRHAPSGTVELLAPAGLRERARSAIRGAPGAVPVALGGGSVMDAVRLAALDAADPDPARTEPDGWVAWPSTARNPCVCIPSTLGTAAEVSPIAVVRRTGSTTMVVSPGLRASAVVIDPIVTATLPRPALAAGLIEPLARVVVPAVCGADAELQDAIAGALTRTLLDLGDRIDGADERWRRTAALTSIQTHTALLAIDRHPAGHLLWPLAMELASSACVSKAAALARLLPAWLRCVAAGEVGAVWGTPRRVAAVLGCDADEAADRIGAWLAALGEPVAVQADVEEVVLRAVTRWQSSGMFLEGVQRDEITAVIGGAIASL